MKDWEIDRARREGLLVGGLQKLHYHLLLKVFTVPENQIIIGVGGK